MPTIYKICPAALRREAARSGVFRSAPADLCDGYIHLSTATQVAETVARHVAGQGDLVLIAVDAAKFGAAVRWESSRGGGLFPHLYGELAPAAVSRVLPLPLGADGCHVLPDLAP